MARSDDERFVDDLREALSLGSIAGTIAAPVTYSRLLEMIVQAAAHVISARAASLFLVDRDTQELVFEVALGPKAEEVKKFRVPLGKGIAGLVAVSGQPMAISNVQEDPRHAPDIARAVGYTPESILCVPLFYGDEIIGVLQLLDKEGASSFAPSDMEILGLFANQAAVAIEQSRIHQNLAALLGEVLASLSDVPDHKRENLRERAQQFARRVEEDEGYKRALGLAQLVHYISVQGEDEAEACRTLLQGFADYLRSRVDYSGGMGARL